MRILSSDFAIKITHFCVFPVKSAPGKQSPVKNIIFTVLGDKNFQILVQNYDNYSICLYIICGFPVKNAPVKSFPVKIVFSTVIRNNKFQILVQNYVNYSVYLYILSSDFAVKKTHSCEFPVKNVYAGMVSGKKRYFRRSG